MTPRSTPEAGAAEAVAAIDTLLADPVPAEPVLAGPPRPITWPPVEIRRSWVRDPFSGVRGGHGPADASSVVDDHLQLWLNNGWTLRAATTAPSPGVAQVDLVHTFIWERDHQTTAP